ncbi:MAG: pyridoxine 5'-phosphate synthase, partial [Proteobacteria bacterium]|nr:pyridoxine 5'-phosphate synthase [Pseudomonadota bacterium]
MTALSVNVNKIAVLRNSRGGDAPDVIRAARTCIAAGS